MFARNRCVLMWCCLLAAVCIAAASASAVTVTLLPGGVSAWTSVSSNNRYDSMDTGDDLTSLSADVTLSEGPWNNNPYSEASATASLKYAAIQHNPDTITASFETRATTYAQLFAIDPDENGKINALTNQYLYVDFEVADGTAYLDLQGDIDDGRTGGGPAGQTRMSVTLQKAGSPTVLDYQGNGSLNMFLVDGLALSPGSYSLTANMRFRSELPAGTGVASDTDTGAVSYALAIYGDDEDWVPTVPEPLTLGAVAIALAAVARTTLRRRAGHA